MTSNLVLISSAMFEASALSADCLFIDPDYSHHMIIDCKDPVYVGTAICAHTWVIMKLLGLTI